MLHEHRDLHTARILILANQPSEGCSALWERGRLDQTVEALVLQPEWRPILSASLYCFGVRVSGYWSTVLARHNTSIDGVNQCSDEYTDIIVDL